MNNEKAIMKAEAELRELRMELTHLIKHGGVHSKVGRKIQEKKAEIISLGGIVDD